MIISKKPGTENRLSKRIRQKINLTVKSYTTGQEIGAATIVDISAGGMQFCVPADYPKLQIQEICGFIFDLPRLDKTNVLGEIRYYRDFIDPDQHHVVHYGVKFVYLSKTTWYHIHHCCCQNETETPVERIPEIPNTPENTTSTAQTLTSKILALVKAQIRLENGSTLNGKIKDINYGGIQVRLSNPIPVNIHLNVHISFENLSFTADGICNQCDDTNRELNLFLANISFHDIQQEGFEILKTLMMKLATHMADSILKSYYKSHGD
jgi:c-di-GMP-binding flagellar brake protein YcgR